MVLNNTFSDDAEDMEVVFEPEEVSFSDIVMQEEDSLGGQAGVVDLDDFVDPRIDEGTE